METIAFLLEGLFSNYRPTLRPIKQKKKKKSVMFNEISSYRLRVRNGDR